MSNTHSDHGNTVAAWSAVVVALIGFIVGCIGTVIASPTVFWIGVAFLPVALIVGKVLALMGFGAQQPE